MPLCSSWTSRPQSEALWRASGPDPSRRRVTLVLRFVLRVTHIFCSFRLYPLFNCCAYYNEPNGQGQQVRKEGEEEEGARAAGRRDG